MTASTVNQKNIFLQGGGEMGALTRAFDWAATALGPSVAWQQSLRTTLSNLLHSAFPMFLFWGEDLLCFYNDAYRPSLGEGGKHPALGKPATKVWPEIWDFIHPLIKQVMASGEPVWYQDQLVPISRNGKVEDVYWTFSYSPAFGDSGEIAGVLVTCMETTGTVLERHRLAESENKFRSLVQNAPFPVAVYNGREMIIETVNVAFAETVHKTEEALMGQSALEVVVASPEQRAGFQMMADKLMSDGQPIYFNEQSVSIHHDGIEEQRIFNFVWEPLRDEDGNVTGIMSCAFEITEQAQARRKAEESELELQFAIDAADLGVWDFNPATGKFSGNDRLKSWFGLPPSAEIELTLAITVMVEEDRQRVSEAIGRALQWESGGRYDIEYTIVNPASGERRIVRAVGKATFNAEQVAFRFNGILQDVTKQAIARIELAESKLRFSAAVEAVEGVLWTNTAQGEMEGEQAGWAALTGQSRKQYQGYGWASAVHPDDAQPTIEAWEVAVAAKSTFDFQHRVKRADGSWGTYSIRAIPVLDETNEIKEWVGVHTDITGQVASRQRLEASEAKLRAVINSAPAAIGLLVGRDMLVEMPNQSFINILGKGTDIAGKPLREVLPELVTEGSPLLDILDEVYTTGVAYQSSDMLVRLFRNGVMNDDHFNFSYTPLRDETGAVYAILDVAIDVTDTVRAKLATEEAEAQLRSAVELAELGTWSIDVATNGLTYSPRLIEWFGYDPSAKDYSEVIPILSEEDQRRVSAAVARALTPGSDGIYEETYTVIHPRTGQKRVLHAHGKVVTDTSGKAIRMNGTAQDITMQRERQQELEREVQERTAELLRSNEDLLQFAHVASHDLKEPVRKIKTFAGFIDAEKDRLSERSRMALDKVQGAADRMELMINGVLAYSTLAATEMHMESIDLNETLRSVEGDLEVVIAQKNASLHYSALPQITGAPVLIHQLFYNLVNNALKFSRAGVSPVIRMSSQVEPDGLSIFVQDNGIGFAPEYAERIFKTFTRLNSKDKYEGTGLGLSLCKKIVERHRGRIRAEGAEGKGARFIISLPKE